MAFQIQVRRGTTAEWAAADPVIPATGEPCMDTDTGVVKWGDGATTYALLPEATGGGSTYVNLDGGHATTNYGGLDPIDGGDA